VRRSLIGKTIFDQYSPERGPNLLPTKTPLQIDTSINITKETKERARSSSAKFRRYHIKTVGVVGMPVEVGWLYVE
jgi:hypothetical protein